MRHRNEIWCCLATPSRRQQFASVQETAERWGHEESYVRRLCIARRVEGAFRTLTFEAFPNAPDLRFAWRIPADAPKPTLFYTRLTETQKVEIAQRALEGERKAALAQEYAVTRAYVHRLANRKAQQRATEASAS